jgi:hypothetical protein
VSHLAESPLSSGFRTYEEGGIVGRHVLSTRLVLVDIVNCSLPSMYRYARSSIRLVDRLDDYGLFQELSDPIPIIEFCTTLVQMERSRRDSTDGV